MTSPTTQSSLRRRFKGTVTSDGMDKTISVLVETPKMHPKYKKRYKRTKVYLVHDEQNAYHVGDAVEFVECRPLSARKRWRVIPKASASA